MIAASGGRKARPNKRPVHLLGRGGVKPRPQRIDACCCPPVRIAQSNPNVVNLLPAKTAKLAPEHAICALARLGQDFTYGEVRLDLPETARGHI